MNGARVGALVLLPLAFAAACASTLPPDGGRERPLTPSTQRDAGIVQAFTDGGIQPNPVMDARLAEYESFHDWRSMVFVTGAPSDEPIFRAARAMPKRGKPKAAAQIRAYTFLGGCEKPSAFGMPFEEDGSLCSGVIGRSALLDERERAAVMELVTEAEAGLSRGEKRAHVRCDFNPHHVFVFFDDKGTPTGRVEPCFECGQFAWEPSMHPEQIGDYEPPMMTEVERRTLEDIADRHGLGAWAFDSDGADTKRVREYRDALYGTPQQPTPRGIAHTEARLARPPPVNREVSPKQMSARDRDKLCDWWDDQFRGHDLGGLRSKGYECESGLKYRFELEAGDCEKKFLQCDVPAKSIEQCLRIFGGPPMALCNGFPAECGGLERCIPGLTFTPAK